MAEISACTFASLTASGRGLPLLKTTNFISHRGAERRSRLYVPFHERLGRRARLVRYDQRGGGLSTRHVPPLTIEAMCEDMLAVADAAKIERFFLFGYSQGVAYAVAGCCRARPLRGLGPHRD
ncbi:MAG: hypothetical protein EOR84_14595 [Mesorhizobium sp.]|uniref:alpha/beta fold hydrolase n=1 Tax=Mesorhizobium sp. TaxID=1871066 RepID=UPI000FE530E5|nr:alpha/beta fold hydrolase [Mesorhizobium sp.]RWM95795.1 MAG: hypothetical protein EOR84_14595 [Mesorhizobium sp.]